jgi:hypothetical protein
MPDTAIRMICDAIRRRNLVGFVVAADGSCRIVAPHAFGQGVDGRPVLWAWCVRATENEFTLTGAWMLRRLDQIRDVNLS